MVLVCSPKKCVECFHKNSVGLVVQNRITAVSMRTEFIRFLQTGLIKNLVPFFGTPTSNHQSISVLLTDSPSDRDICSVVEDAFSLALNPDQIHAPVGFGMVYEWRLCMHVIHVGRDDVPHSSSPSRYPARTSACIMGSSVGYTDNIPPHPSRHMV